RELVREAVRDHLLLVRSVGEHDVQVGDAALLRLPDALQDHRAEAAIGHVLRRAFRRQRGRGAQLLPAPRARVRPLARSPLLDPAAIRAAVLVLALTPVLLEAISLVPRQPLSARSGDRDQHHGPAQRSQIRAHALEPVARPTRTAARTVAPFAGAQLAVMADMRAGAPGAIPRRPLLHFELLEVHARSSSRARETSRARSSPSRVRRYWNARHQAARGSGFGIDSMRPRVSRAISVPSRTPTGGSA